MSSNSGLVEDIADPIGRGTPIDAPDERLSSDVRFMPCQQQQSTAILLQELIASRAETSALRQRMTELKTESAAAATSLQAAEATANRWKEELALAKEQVAQLESIVRKNDERTEQRILSDLTMMPAIAIHEQRQKKNKEDLLSTKSEDNALHEKIIDINDKKSSGLSVGHDNEAPISNKMFYSAVSDLEKIQTCEPDKWHELALDSCRLTQQQMTEAMGRFDDAIGGLVKAIVRDVCLTAFSQSEHLILSALAMSGKKSTTFNIAGEGGESGEIGSSDLSHLATPERGGNGEAPTSFMVAGYGSDFHGSVVPKSGQEIVDSLVSTDSAIPHTSDANHLNTTLAPPTDFPRIEVDPGSTVSSPKTPSLLLVGPLASSGVGGARTTFHSQLGDTILSAFGPSRSASGGDTKTTSITKVDDDKSQPTNILNAEQNSGNVPLRHRSASIRSFTTASDHPTDLASTTDLAGTIGNASSLRRSTSRRASEQRQQRHMLKQKFLLVVEKELKKVQIPTLLSRTQGQNDSAVQPKHKKADVLTQISNLEKVPESLSSAFNKDELKQALASQASTATEAATAIRSLISSTDHVLRVKDFELRKALMDKHKYRTMLEKVNSTFQSAVDSLRDKQMEWRRETMRVMLRSLAEGEARGRAAARAELQDGCESFGNKDVDAYLQGIYLLTNSNKQSDGDGITMTGAVESTTTTAAGDELAAFYRELYEDFEKDLSILRQQQEEDGSLGSVAKDKLRLTASYDLSQELSRSLKQKFLLCHVYALKNTLKAKERQCDQLSRRAVVLERHLQQSANEHYQRWMEDRMAKGVVAARDVASNLPAESQQESFVKGDVEVPEDLPNVEVTSTMVSSISNAARLMPTSNQFVASTSYIPIPPQEHQLNKEPRGSSAQEDDRPHESIQNVLDDHEQLLAAKGANQTMVSTTSVPEDHPKDFETLFPKKGPRSPTGPRGRGMSSSSAASSSPASLLSTNRPLRRTNSGVSSVTGTPTIANTRAAAFDPLSYTTTKSSVSDSDAIADALRMVAAFGSSNRPPEGTSAEDRVDGGNVVGDFKAEKDSDVAKLPRKVAFAEIEESADTFPSETKPLEQHHFDPNHQVVDDAETLRLADHPRLVEPWRRRSPELSARRPIVPKHYQNKVHPYEPVTLRQPEFAIDGSAIAENVLPQAQSTSYIQSSGDESRTALQAGNMELAWDGPTQHRHRSYTSHPIAAHAAPVATEAAAYESLAELGSYVAVVKEAERANDRYITGSRGSIGGGAYRSVIEEGLLQPANHDSHGYFVALDIDQAPSRSVTAKNRSAAALGGRSSSSAVLAARGSPSSKVPNAPEQKACLSPVSPQLYVSTQQARRAELLNEVYAFLKR